MEALDRWLADLGGGSLLLALVAALLLGLRHATDPDHLTALSTLVLGEDRDRGGRRAARLGAAWGAGHATTLIALGLPVVLFGVRLSGGVQRVLETLVGVIIVALAVRLLVRWRRGRLHSHAHVHGVVVHAHPHVHEGPRHVHGGHDHAHAERLGRTPLAAFCLGLLHGAGGSAAVGVLLVAAVPGRAAGAVALALFAGACALSMAVLSGLFGRGLAAGRGRLVERLTPALGIAALVFGVVYAGAAATI
jgi:ABC-type nickel/cobalt efflux system permease component RcnA